ncbi:GntR family transcriptional regulator [Niallia sp. NCCP-28]|uniref:GntR family transcriptional regulator n=1 Tax=Niallia sp. NCCP-28 TaxID=2934712 RepID=UPI00208AFAF5|nr:GntR family transcriptional regulator [Niallia sp. NCCP-28]GKU81477.1 GntR family transcriptional regulator [Niallia sp. NCCP-28]
MSKIGINKVQKLTAVKQTIEYLKQYILRTNEHELKKLPSETKLAAEMGVSRVTVREALTVLENEGFITRSQGSSTIITTFARKLTGIIDSSGELSNFIKESGYQANVDNITYSWEKCDKKTAEYLKIEPGDEILMVKKRFLADHAPAVYCINRIAKKHLQANRFGEDDLGQNIFTYLEETSHVHFSHDFMELIPTLADEELGKMLHLPINTPLLRLDITKYTDEGIPIMFNSEYYVHDLIKFTACRTLSNI